MKFLSLKGFIIFLIVWTFILNISFSDITDIPHTHDTDSNVITFPIKSTEYNDTAIIIANVTNNKIHFFIQVSYPLPRSTDDLVLKQYFEANLVVINNNEQCQVISSNMTYIRNESLFNVDYFCRENIRNLDIIHQLFGVFLEKFDNKLIINYKSEEKQYNLNRTVILASFNTESTDLGGLTSSDTTPQPEKKNPSPSAVKAPFSNYIFILLSLLVLLLVYKYISSRRKSQFSWGKRSFFDF